MHNLTKLSEYKPYPFIIRSIDLDFTLNDNNTIVKSIMKIESRNKSDEALILEGVDINLISIKINGGRISNLLYEYKDNQLIIPHPPLSLFELEIHSELNPYQNTSLEGLYESEGMLVTQCEAIGFRRICFHPDRPDVLSTYRVRIESEKERFPVLLSNGNKVYEGDLNNNKLRKEVVWEDPFPKPSYLFALVAGDLIEVNSTFKTKSEKLINIGFFVEKGNGKYTEHAINSLKKAMKWDEEIYNLEYDLDVFNVVAVRHFNMGAMENKSLNIFNSKLVFADPEITTDEEFERIESVVAHEYFHNWTGNRITCRDWFQLSLKEGLTVFRDQSFTSDIHSYALKRIDDVQLLRKHQFKEDSGPTSHAVKPQQYFAIDNFYTTTIYEKGAELIRMLKILMGEKSFMRGMKLYLDRFDGSAATTEDFVYSLVDEENDLLSSLNFDIDQFVHWYYQPGTPKVKIKRFWDSKNGKLVIKFEQYINDENTHKPLVIPILYSIVSKFSKSEEKLFILKETSQQLILEDIPNQKDIPLIGFFRSFSAPVTWETDISTKEHISLLLNCDDPFLRWDSGQTLIRKVILERALSNPNIELENILIQTFIKLIESNDEEDKSLLVKYISTPDISELEQHQKFIDPCSLHDSMIFWEELVGSRLQNYFWNLIHSSKVSLSGVWPIGQTARSITSISWRFLAASGDLKVRDECLKAISGGSMTLARSAIHALINVDCEERDIALESFYKRWEHMPVILDSWFAFEASAPRINSLSRIKLLFEHHLYDPLSPNTIRAILGGLVKNTKAFHCKNGEGYKFMADKIILIDKSNPITASRLVKIFSKWNLYKQDNKEKMFKEIIKISNSNLSSNTREVVDLILK